MKNFKKIIRPAIAALWAVLISGGCANTKLMTVTPDTISGVCPQAYSSKYYKPAAVPEKDYRFILSELIKDVDKLFAQDFSSGKKQIGPRVKIRHDSNRQLKKLLTSSGYQVEYVKLKKNEITEDLVWVDIFNLCGQYVGTVNSGLHRALVKTWLKKEGKLKLQSTSVAAAGVETLMEE